MSTRTKILIVIISILSTAYPTKSFGQTTYTATSDNKNGTYFKVQLAHWQGDIFANNSLIGWKGNIFGSDYNLTSIGVEVETYFSKTHLQLSGWSIGYRKDDPRYIKSGQMFNGKVFRSFNLKVFELKPSAGIEWGVPSANFDKTKFDYSDNNSIRYRHTYPVKNSGIPSVGVKGDGSLYPFMEVGILKRPGNFFLLELGMRVNIMEFGIDDYDITSDKMTYDLKNKKILVPYLFASIGIKMF